MTIKELSQLYYLNREIEQDKQKLAELKAVATDTSVKITGLPHVQGISNKTAIAAEIADIQTTIEAKIQLSVVEYNKLNRYIANINDPFIRQIIALRFVNGLKWRDVAQNIGGGNSENTVKVALHRYLKTCNKCND